ncbi:MAG TPA: DUF5330 domain-containing protein [Parvibaculum sp.]
MSFILRAAFWLTVLSFLLPAAGFQATARNGGTAGATPAAYRTGDPSASPADEVNAGEMLSLAAQSAGDVLGFCGRNPQVCDRGHAVVAHVARQSAYYGSQAFLWLTEKAKEQQEKGLASDAAPTSSSSRHTQSRMTGA